MTQFKTGPNVVIQQGGTGSWESIEQFLEQTVPLTLYIGNLPKTWNEENIKSYFSSYGTILHVQIIKKHKKFSGAAMVQFSSLTKAEEAIQKLKNTTIPGATAPVNMRWSYTDQHRLGRQQTDNHTLFIKSLPRQATVNTLQEVFSLIGELQQVHVEDGKWWGRIKYKQKESAFRAIKLLSGQTFLHGSWIPIQVKFKEKTYNSEANIRVISDPMRIHPTQTVYRQVFNENLHYYYNFTTCQSQYEPPAPGSLIHRMDGSTYIQPEPNVCNLNDMPTGERLSGPPGANLFVFHLPNNLKDSDLFQIFQRFGTILSYRVMTTDNKSRGFGFVNFDNTRSATEAIEQMNGFQIQGKKLKVQLKKGPENNTGQGQPVVSLSQIVFNPL